MFKIATKLYSKSISAHLWGWVSLQLRTLVAIFLFGLGIYLIPISWFTASPHPDWAEPIFLVAEAIAGAVWVLLMSGRIRARTKSQSQPHRTSNLRA
jgi:hypothetical protein